MCLGLEITRPKKNAYMPKTQQIVVTVLFDDAGYPDKIVWGNGTVKWYQLTEMSLADHNEFLQADNVKDENSR